MHHHHFLLLKLVVVAVVLFAGAVLWLADFSQDKKFYKNDGNL
jgi:hypothetical protein